MCESAPAGRSVGQSVTGCPELGGSPSTVTAHAGNNHECRSKCGATPMSLKPVKITNFLNPSNRVPYKDFVPLDNTNTNSSSCLLSTYYISCIAAEMPKNIGEFS